MNLPNEPNSELTCSRLSKTASSITKPKFYHQWTNTAYWKLSPQLQENHFHVHTIQHGLAITEEGDNFVFGWYPVLIYIHPMSGKPFISIPSIIQSHDHLFFVSSFACKTISSQCVFPALNSIFLCKLFTKGSFLWSRYGQAFFEGRTWAQPGFLT